MLLAVTMVDSYEACPLNTVFKELMVLTYMFMLELHSIAVLHSVLSISRVGKCRKQQREAILCVRVN